MMLKVAFILLFTATISVCQYIQGRSNPPIGKGPLIFCAFAIMQHLQNEQLAKPEPAIWKDNLKNCSTAILEHIQYDFHFHFRYYVWMALDCQAVVTPYLRYNFYIKPESDTCRKDNTTCVPTRDKIEMCLSVFKKYIENEEPPSNACSLPADCVGATPYCLNGECVAANDKVCVAEGVAYTGGLSCCYPMVNPKKRGLPCRILSTEDCSRDVHCGTRYNNNQYVCCNNYRGGRGMCLTKNGITDSCHREAFGKVTAYERARDY